MGKFRVFVMIVLFAAVPQVTKAGWFRILGGDQMDAASCVQEISEGGYIVSGWTEIDENDDIWLLKFNEDGDTVWTKTFGNGLAYYVQQTSDGGYILTGKPHTLLKTDPNGEIIWSRSYFSNTFEMARCIHQTADGGYIVLIWNPYDLCYTQLLKTDKDGDTLWTRTYQASGGTLGTNMQQTVDGGYIITGYKRPYPSSETSYNLWLSKLDSDGSTLWQKNFSSTMPLTEGMYVQQTSDGGFIVTGYTGEKDSSGSWNQQNMLLLKTDTQGNKIWIRTYEEFGRDVGNCIQQIKDGNYVVAGRQGIAKFDETGDVIWRRESEDLVWYAFFNETQEGDFIICGLILHLDSEKNQYLSNLYLLKTNSQGIVEVNEQPFVLNKTKWKIKTVVAPIINIQYSDHLSGFHALIFDASGRKVDEIHSTSESGIVTWGEGFTPGVYFTRPMTDVSTAKKVVLIK
ncbi:hypothetical protein JXM67_10015 [candidate division WOR-3 bacterium]|nr:hypothetical protein [candidate division WOR-3 bacterium]